MPICHDDLSYIHHAGFGDFALGAAPGQGSFLNTELPRCDAVTSMGEPFSYIPDDMDAPPPLADLFSRVRQALRLGGVFLFDLVVRSGQQQARARRTA